MRSGVLRGLGLPLLPVLLVLAGCGDSVVGGEVRDAAPDVTDIPEMDQDVTPAPDVPPPPDVPTIDKAPPVDVPPDAPPDVEPDAAPDVAPDVPQDVSTGECRQDSDCAGNPRGSACDTAVGRCVRCVNDGHCMAGESCCAATCVNLRASTTHCGSCGNACGGGVECIDGRCTVPCPAGQTRCEGACTALANDPNHCGVCGNRCRAGALCGAGMCVDTCSAPSIRCGDSCTAAATDNDNCGACGNRCTGGRVCVAGACTCPTGQSFCDGACVDTRTSVQHCGTCGAVCNPGYRCAAGACVLSCPAPQVVCGAVCANLQTDPNHCGRCDRACPTGCFGGDCARVDVIEAGLYNVCARYTSGRVFCWGLNNTGNSPATGLLTTSGGSWGHRSTPVSIVDSTGVAVESVEQVVMGTNRACARFTGGSVRCWALGVQMNAVNGLPPVTQLSAKETNFCGLARDGQVYCWDGLPRAATAAALAPVGGVTGAVELATGTNFSCARSADNAVRCWGTGNVGQLGQGAFANSATAVAVRGLTDATAVVAGREHACARRMDGTVTCWGLNTDGQLGDGTVMNRNAPVAVTGLTCVTALRAGLRYNCALAGGAMRCWGDNTWSQLGDGTTTDRSTPVAVAGISTTRDLAVYEHHSCAVAMDNTVRCWGYNPFGEAGGGTEAQPTPVPVQFEGADLTGITAIETGAGYNAALGASTNWRCALHQDGRVLCWGPSANGNEAGQLGDGTNVARATPAPVRGLTDATQITTGWQHACALRRGGAVVCWGRNTEGQLGNGTNVNSNVPVAVTGVTDATEVRAGDNHTCAILRDRTVRCWGQNFYGNLGNSEMISANTPRVAFALDTAVQLQTGMDHTCARLADSTVRCWGRNIEGQVGDGFRTNQTTPTRVEASTSTPTMIIPQAGFTSLRCEVWRCWGRHMDGRVLGWGWGYANRATNIAALAMTVDTSRGGWGDGSENECELRTDNRTYCRGRNEYGQLGLGRVSLTENLSVLMGDFAQVRVGRGYTAPCAVERGTGRVLCWGWTGNGSLLAAGVTGLTTMPAEVRTP